jgi:hypothetical protein
VATESKHRLLCQLEKRIPYQVTHSTRPRTENKPKEFLADKNNIDARSMGMNPSAAKPTWGRPIWPGALCLRGHKSDTQVALLVIALTRKEKSWPQKI